MHAALINQEFDPVPPVTRFDASAPLHLLTFTTLFPSAARPRHGIFVEARLKHLVATGRVHAEVLAPVPWFPFTSPRFGSYGAIGRTPSEETRFGVRIHHPRYAVVPKLGMRWQPHALAATAIRKIEELLRQDLRFDIIDAHYFYPDGIAAGYLARRFGKPLVVTARGSDINLLAQLSGPRRQILETARAADRIIAVSQSLADGMESLGIEPAKITVLRNGVDTDLFIAVERELARARLSVARPVLLASVGNLVPEKGHDLVIRALARLPDAELVVVGEGPAHGDLKALTTALGVQSRVRFLSAMPQEELKFVYSAADVLVLASLREGWPNVILEALACGTPVVASDVGGIREIVIDCMVGEIVKSRSSETLAEAIQRVIAAQPSRQALRQYAQSFGWEAVSRGQLRLFHELIAH